ncbi:MAG: MarR family transcriptional regulator [Hyphomicrobiales bacterium]|nr:MarR family transcriptional regulator [Hyphomicrobiales bacterium]
MNVENMKLRDIESDYVLEEQIGYVLRIASQKHASIFQKHSIDGLTPTQFSALMRIAEIGECSQNRLGRLTSMDVATIKGVVDRLKKKGLLGLESDPNDKRRTIIKLTEASKNMIKNLHEAGRRISEETLEPLSPAEQATLLGLLKKIS